jgi:hypothetical protein
MMSVIYKYFRGGGSPAMCDERQAIYKRRLRCLRLMYEALMNQPVQGRLAPSLADETRGNL